MAKSNPKPKKERTEGRVVKSPHTGEVKTIAGTKAGKKRVLRAPTDPDRNHDGKTFRSNSKRFSARGVKHGTLTPEEQMKRTGTKENPYI